jgi:autotransporter-associated beta strand protein
MCYDTLTISTAISGTVGVDKNGSGNLTLTAANTYTGVTTIKNGTLALTGAVNRLPITSVVVVGDTSTAGKLVLGNTTAATNQTLASLTSTGSGGSVVGGNANDSTLTLSVPQFGNFTFAGKIGGIGSNENKIKLVKLGQGELTLTGNNTYTGGTFLGSPSSNGIVIAGHNNAFGAGPITMNSNYSQLRLADGITISNALTVSAQANIKYLGLLTGATSATYAGNIVNSEDAQFNFVLVADIGGTLTVSGIISSGVGVSSGLSKKGEGTVVLTGANTYVGGTQINVGSLIVSKTSGSVTATATFGELTLSVSFNTTPSIGQTFIFFPAATVNTYGSVTLTNAAGRSATYNSANSTLTIS